MTRGWLPVFVSVTVCPLVVEPCGALPKSRLDGDTAARGPSPTPVSSSACVLPGRLFGELSVMLTNACSVPTVLGAKLSSNEQFVPGARVAPAQLPMSEKEKSALFGPVIAGDPEITSGASPVFTTAPSWGTEFCVPIATEPKLSFAALKETLGAAAALSAISMKNASLTGGDIVQLTQFGWKPPPVLPAIGKSPAVVCPATYTCPAPSAAMAFPDAVALTPGPAVPPSGVE